MLNSLNLIFLKAFLYSFSLTKIVDAYKWFSSPDSVRGGIMSSPAHKRLDWLVLEIFFSRKASVFWWQYKNLKSFRVGLTYAS